jgi:excisionase family DNA binding protein
VSDPSLAPPSGEWLSLGPAARLVGVDPDTLRRWADDGRVAAYLTPGGHRRFERRALDRFVAARRAGGPRPLASLGATSERLTQAYRRSYARPATPAHPMPDVGEPDREAFRRDGRELVEALLAYLDADGHPARAAAEGDAGRLTDHLATRLAGGGTSLTESVALFVAARRPFLAELGAIARKRRLDSTRLSSLYDEASGLLDRLLLRFVRAHQEAAPMSNEAAR